MIDKKDITILIAGKLNHTSLEFLPKVYQDYNSAVLSYWEDDPKPDQFEELSNEIVSHFLVKVKKNWGYFNQNPKEAGLELNNLTNINFLENPSPTRQGNDYNNSIPEMLAACPTFYYQVAGIVFGLRQVKTKYVIRTRSDEVFGNLDPLIESYVNSGFKFTGINVFWKPSDVYGMYHIGDHMFIAKTEDLLNTYESIFNYMQDKKIPLKELAEKQEFSWGHGSPEDPNLIKVNPENTLALFYLNSLGVPLSDCYGKYKKVLLSNFNMLNVQKLGSYVIKYGAVDKVWVSSDNFGMKFSIKYVDGASMSFNQTEAFNNQCISDSLEEVFNEK